MLSLADFRSLSVVDVNVIHRRLSKLAQDPQIRIAYLGNQTLEPLPDYIDVCCACEGIVAAQYIGAYNQHFQELLDPASKLAAFKPDVIFLALSLRDLSPRLYYAFSSLSEEDTRAEFDRIIQQLTQWVEVAKGASGATLLLSNLASPVGRQAGIADSKDPNGEMEFYLRLNLELLRICRSEPRVHLFDLEGLIAHRGKSKALSERLYFLARREWDEAFLPDIAREMLKYVLALTGRARKCLVLDLDNTLWGGIVGEDGPEGVRITKGDPEGEAYRAFQEAILGLKNRGIILAINSKNNEADVVELFERIQDMPLGLDDFAAVEINWDYKHENLLRIAQTLNIGTDSLVFVDDNPVECALVSSMLPEVKTVLLPGDPVRYAGVLKALPWFERLTLTAEDRAKTRQYLDIRKRSEQRQIAGSLGEYLESLGTTITVRVPTAQNAARIHQLFNKTNQFNLTTKRYAPADVERFLQDEAFDIRVVDVKDSFGDLGTVGLVLIERDRLEPSIDSFILSCRAMGRGIESAIMNCIKEDYLLSDRHHALRAMFIPTNKNTPVEHFYDGQGFCLDEERDTGERLYRLDADGAALVDCGHIAISRDS